MADFIENKLKSKSVSEIETIISKAISEAIGEEFEATISAVDFGNGIMPEAKFSVKLSYPSKWGKDA